MQLPLLPLPVGILSDWVPIADANYVRPAHSGEYDVSSKYIAPVRVRYCADSDTWACDGGGTVWKYATAWRGCTVPFVDTAL